MLDTSTIVSFGSLTLTALAVLSAALTARHSKRSKEERQAAARQQLREADRLEAEEERISVNAAREAVRMIRQELKEAHDENARQRGTIEKQDERIDHQGQVIRRQTLRIELQHQEIGALRRHVAVITERVSMLTERLTNVGIDPHIADLPEVPRATELVDYDIWPPNEDEQEV